jgi:hypothetical protein
MMLRWPVVLSFCVLGCAISDDPELDCSEGRCDDSQVPTSPCDGLLVDHSGAGNQKVAGRLNDPFALLALRTGDSCPTTFQEMMAKLRETDAIGCEGDDRAGIETRVVSETAQAMGRPTSYRAVTTRACGGRASDGIIFSLFGLEAGAPTLPPNVEIIAFDERAGVFNYYETDGETLSFFGNSKDMLKGPGAGEDRRCAGCHTGGGLIMKELDTPWLHWEGHMDTPGARELVEAHPDLGRKTDGAELEFLVKTANEKWNKARLSHLRKADGSGTVELATLLAPLFCSVEVNLDNGADFESPVGGGFGGSELRRVPFDSLVDPQFKGFGAVPVTFADYDTLIKANGQRVPGVPGAIDTVFDYVFVERAHADNDFVEALKRARIVDDSFVKDVLAVDFTRPVFSDDRCGLLDFAPVIAGELTAKKTRDGFIANLEAAAPAPGTPAATLLANLKKTGDATAHAARVDAFLAACQALGSPQFLANALAITALNRDKARQLQLFEFEATMPVDNQRVNPGARLHPETCQLVNQFVP